MVDFTKILALVTLYFAALSSSVNAREFKCEPPNSFPCGDGKCIPPEWVCDHRHDCDSMIDEENCPTTCKSDEFNCGDDQCISNRWVCDNEIDCRSRLDELSCDDGVVSNCEENEMNCGNGDCIKLEWKCDGEEDCSNGEDERDCDAGVSDLNITTTDTASVDQTELPEELTTFQETTTPMETTSVPRRRRPNSRRNNRKRVTTPPTTFDPYMWEGGDGTVDSREERRRARKEKKKQAAMEKEANTKPGSDVNDETFNNEPMDKARTTPAASGVQSSNVSTRHTLAVILGVSIGFLVITVLLSLIGHCFYKRRKMRQESITEHYLLQNKD